MYVGQVRGVGGWEAIYSATVPPRHAEYYRKIRIAWHQT
jgi:hypothetical protein